jgi:hypothetical protein
MRHEICSFCHVGELHRVRRRHVDVPFSWVGLYPFRCDACPKRSYRFRRVSTPTREAGAARGSAGRPLLVDLLVRLATGRAS